MAARPRNAAVPAALQPKNAVPRKAPVPQTTEQPADVEQPAPLEIHIAILIDHPKIYDAIKDRIVVVGPQYQPIELHAHVIADDSRHKAKAIHPRVRMAMAELGLVDPVEVGFTYPYQVTLGWPKPEE